NIDLGCSAKEEELLSIPGKGWGPQQQKEMLDTYDERRCEQLLRRFVRNQNWQVPTLALFFADRSITDPRSKYLPSEVRAQWQQQLAKSSNPSPQQKELKQKHQHERLNIVDLMKRTGVPMLAGTDVGNPFVYPGFSLHDELALFVRAGLTPAEALKTATYNPAKLMGMLDRLGTVEKGKLADLVLLDANPLDDIANTQRIRAVLVNGKYLDRAALDKLLSDAVLSASTH